MKKYLVYKKKYLLNKNILDGGCNSNLRIYRLLHNEGIKTEDTPITYNLEELTDIYLGILTLNFIAQGIPISLEILYDKNYPGTPPIEFNIIGNYNFLYFKYIMYIKFIEPFLPNNNNMKFRNYIEFIKNNLLLNEPRYQTIQKSLIIGARPDDIKEEHEKRTFFNDEKIYLLSNEESSNEERYLKVDFNNIDELNSLNGLKFQTICFDYSTWKFFALQNSNIEDIIQRINLLSNLLSDDGILIIPEPLNLTMLNFPDIYIKSSQTERKIIIDNINKEYRDKIINVFINSELKFNFILSESVQNKVFKDVTNSHLEYLYKRYSVLIATKK